MDKNIAEALGGTVQINFSPYSTCRLKGWQYILPMSMMPYNAFLTCMVMCMRLAVPDEGLCSTSLANHTSAVSSPNSLAWPVLQG